MNLTLLFPCHKKRTSITKIFQWKYDKRSGIWHRDLIKLKIRGATGSQKFWAITNFWPKKTIGQKKICYKEGCLVTVDTSTLKQTKNYILGKKNGHISAYNSNLINVRKPNFSQLLELRKEKLS